MRTPKGLTFVELLIAISITAVVGAAVAGITVAVANAGVSSDELHECLQAARVARVRLSQDLQPAALITAVDDERLLFWTGDADGNGRINVDELVMLRFDDGSDCLWRYSVEFPEDMHWLLKLILNRQFTLNQAMNGSSVEFWLRASWYSRETLVATNVAAVDFWAQPAAPLSKFARVELTIRVGEHSVTEAAGVALRADRTGDVVYQGGRYRLVTE